MGAEDSEYVQRASERGFTGRYSPEPLVWHHHGRKPADVPALFRGYYRGWGAFYACLLGRSPGLVWRAVREDFSARPGGLGYLRLLYWRLLAWPPRRAWHVGRGALDYARLGRGGAERRGEGAEAARRAAGGKDERPFPAP